MPDTTRRFPRLVTDGPRLPSLEERRANAESNLGQARVRNIPINRIRENPDNPRRDPGDLTTLAQSIREKGLLEPLGVRYDPGTHDRYVVLYGNRRFGALNLLWGSADPDTSQKAFLVPCRIVDVEDDDEAYVLAVAENVAREDLTPDEKVEAIWQIHRRYPTWTNAQIGEAIGVDKTLVGSYLRQRDPAYRDVGELAEAGVINRTVATELIRAPEPIRREIIEEIRAGAQPTIREVRERRQNPAPTPPLPSPTTFESGRESPFNLGAVEVPQRPTTPPQVVTLNNTTRHLASFLDTHWHSAFSIDQLAPFQAEIYRALEFVQHQLGQQKRPPADD
jgi:ParB/RepB/Spo0J family partition protein